MACATLSLDVARPDDISPEADLAQARMLTARFPTIVAAHLRIAKGAEPIAPRADLPLAANFLYMVHGKEPDPIVARALDTYWVTVMDHGMNASTFAGRVIASTRSDMVSAVTGAIGALKGPLHGGANQRVMEMILDINDVATVDAYVAGMLENKQRIMGFGHRVYRTEDPRTRHLRKYSELLCASSNQRHLHDIAQRIEKKVLDAKGMYPNVDFYSATVQHAMGIPPEYFTTVFAAARTAGWIAHIIEQYADNRLIRPTSRYTGDMGLLFVPMKDRKA
jgi:citrate synthase